MDLVKSEFTKEVSVQYKGMLSDIAEYYPKIEKDTRNFCKTQSQFMDTMMTVHQPTPLRSLRQILAEVTNSKMALNEAYFKSRKAKIELEKKQRKMEACEDPLDKQIMMIEIEEAIANTEMSRGYVEGAIRRVHAYLEQYKNLLQKYGKDEFTEEDFEEDEARYHVMTAFDQALCAARARGGVIDEGNQIYFYQIGVNGGAAQYELAMYLASEGRMFEAGQLPTHEMTTEWLEAMGRKYAFAAQDFAARKGMQLVSTTSLHTRKELPES